MAKRRTMGDIAERAGVSRSTVSRVLNGEPVVSVETEGVVRRLAAELGYHMRPSRKGIKQDRGPRRIMIVTQTPLDSGGGLAALGSALVSGLSERGWVADFVCWDSLTAERLMGVTGAFLLGGVPEGASLDRLVGVPCIQLLGLPVSSDPVLDVVTIDYHSVGVLAADWLIKKNCRHLVAVMPTNAIARMRERAFVDRVRECGCEVSVIHCEGAAILAENALAVVKQVHALKPLPDGLFAFNDHAILVLYSHLMKSGFDLEKGMRLIGCDAEPFLKALSPQPATIDIHIVGMARRAIETLIWRMENPKTRPVTIMLRPEIVEPSADSRC